MFAQDRNGAVILERQKAAGRYCSSYDGECVAMIQALEWIEQQADDGARYAIYTDSRCTQDQ